MKTRKHVFMFQSRFAAAVKDGGKTQTIRPLRQREPKISDGFEAREWSGRPYRSQQRCLTTGVITGVSRINLGLYVTRVDGLTVYDCDSLAKADGFADFNEMLDWFNQVHGLPFYGLLIKWKPL
jgi:hypothetical protein